VVIIESRMRCTLGRTCCPAGRRGARAVGLGQEVADLVPVVHDFEVTFGPGALGGPVSTRNARLSLTGAIPGFMVGDDLTGSDLYGRRRASGTGTAPPRI
jgi:hypothetical protein